MKRWAISKFINIVLLLPHVSESCAIYVMHVRVFFPAHPSVCTGSSCSGEEHSVQTDLWTLQTPPHHTEGDHLSNHLTTSELLLKHTNTHTCTSVKKTNTHTFSLHALTTEFWSPFLGICCEECWPRCREWGLCSRGPEVAEQPEGQYGAERRYTLWRPGFTCLVPLAYTPKITHFPCTSFLFTMELTQ